MYWDIKDYLKKLDDYGVLEEAINYIKEQYKWNDDEFDQLKMELRSNLALIDIKKKFPIKTLQRKRNELKELPEEIEGLETDLGCLEEEIDDIKEKIAEKKAKLEKLLANPPSVPKDEKPKPKRIRKPATKKPDGVHVESLGENTPPLAFE